MIMGKRTFNEIENIENMGSLYPTTQNYVFTHDESLSDRGFIPINCDVVEFVKQIERDKNIWIVGGSTILAPLLDNDMVDNMLSC
ncbi:dihydrofolate reductase [Priestia flexa]|uniref:dihydrofolate reductase family protein n=1 Tax=Priestia flexa TaxID=86664 RepID=UPI00209E09E1|nr:dihydrofolate reductase [Priestia flexa]MCP1187831.1 dihydrofolate reductase [Priestia flexa]